MLERYTQNIIYSMNINILKKCCKADIIIYVGNSFQLIFKQICLKKYYQPTFILNTNNFS